MASATARTSWRAGCVETRTSGSEARAGETGRRKRRHRAPARPYYYLLEERFECWLLNAQHLRNVPGRKTDVADSAWICQLVEHGLVRASFVPPKPIRELRDLTRYRKAQIEERSREVQRLDKVLQDAGIKLSSVASETLGVSVRRMLEALVAGTHDPEVLAELARGRLRRKLPALREALTGRFRSEHHGLLIAQILAHIDYLDETIATLSARVEQVIAPFSTERELLMTIPGVARLGAEVLIAEIGVDMRVFPSDAHLASWAGQCPGNHESAGKRAQYDTDRVGEIGLAQQGHLPQRPVQPAARPARPRQGNRRPPPLDPRRRLPHPRAQGPLRRTRSRLLRPAPLARTTHETARLPAPAARAHGDARATGDVAMPARYKRPRSRPSRRFSP